MQANVYTQIPMDNFSDVLYLNCSEMITFAEKHKRDSHMQTIDIFNRLPDKRLGKRGLYSYRLLSTKRV
jgi:hypothetical protein